MPLASMAGVAEIGLSRSTFPPPLMASAASIFCCTVRVEHSISTCPGLELSSTPSSPLITASSAPALGSEVITTSEFSETSRGLAAGVRPSFSRAAVTSGRMSNPVT